MRGLIKTAVSLILLLTIAGMCLAGCSSGSGKPSAEDINSMSMGDVCRIGNYDYYAPSWSFYRVPADGGDSETLAHDIGCRMLSEHDGMLYMVAQKAVDGAPDTQTAILRYDPGEDTFDTICEFTMSADDDFQNFSEIGTYCVDGDRLYFLLYESVDGAVTTYLCTVGADGGQVKAICSLPEGFMPLPYADIVMHDGLVCVGVYPRDGGDQVLLPIDPSDGSVSGGMSWSGSKDDKLFACDSGIAVCSVRGGVTVYASPDGGEGKALVSGEDMRCFFVNGKYAVYSHSEIYLEEEGVRYTANAGIYVLDLETGAETKISDKFCEIIGLCGDSIYYYDEDELRGFTELSQLSQHSFRSKLCRINADGSDDRML